MQGLLETRLINVHTAGLQAAQAKIRCCSFTLRVISCTSARTKDGIAGGGLRERRGRTKRGKKYKDRCKGSFDGKMVSQRPERKLKT